MQSKNCASLLLATLTILVSSTSVAVEPTLEWSYDTGGTLYASPMLADLDGDGTVEVIVCASRAKRVLCLDGKGVVQWEYRVEDSGIDGIQATPSIVDFDGDGKKEVFFLSNGGVATCLDSQGRLIWRTFTGDRIDYSGPVVADIDNDERIEVVFGSESGTLYCLDDAGIELWHYQGDGAIRGIPAVALNEDTGTMSVYVTFGAGVGASISSEGNLLWSHEIPSARKERRSGPAVGDLDGDGRLEVVFAADEMQATVFDAFTGEEEWSWNGAHKIDQTSSFALADFDGSGRLDVVCGDGTGLGGPGNIYRVRDGEALWTAEIGGGIVQGPSIGDVDGDGQLEILACSRSQRLVCLSAEGKEEWEFPTKVGSLTTPALGDVDGDGKVEIVITSKDCSVYCVTVDGVYDPQRLPWPCMNHDSQLSGNMGGAPFSATVPDKPERKVPVLAVTQFGPLRLGTNEVAFSFANLSHRPHHLELSAEIIHPDGNSLTFTKTGRFEAYSDEEAAFGLPALKAGKYSLRVQLLDVGAGRVLDTVEETTNLVPLEEENREFEALAGEAGQILDTVRLSVQEDPLAAVVPVWEEARKNLQDSVNAGSDPASLNGAIDKVREALRELQRSVARLRAAKATLPTPSAPLDFAVVSTSTLVKVFKDEPFLDGSCEPSPASISVAGNELEGVQIVVVPLWKDLGNLTVSVGDLAHAAGKGKIAAQDVIIHRIGYVETGTPMYSYRVEKQGFYPDVAFPNSPVDVPLNQDAQPFFVTVKASEETPPGDYRGVVRVEAEGCTPIEVPLNVHVWDFHLAKETHLKTSLWFSEGSIRSFYKYKDGVPWEVRKRYYDYQLEHRSGAIKDFPVGGGEGLEDVEYLMANGQNNLFYPLPHHLDEADRPAFAERLNANREIIREKGWDDKMLFYTRDEVAVMGRNEIPTVVELSKWVRTVNPDWPLLQTSAPEQSLFEGVDIWCPTTDKFDPKVLKDRMEKGDRLWFYAVWGRPGIMIDFPSTDYRLMFWQCWKYGAEGYLYWGTTHWGYNTQGKERWPEVPWIPWNAQRGHNGCGYMIYPGPDGTPIGSTRFEIVRDGIEDYEYLYLLNQLVEKAGEDAPADLRNRAKAELAVPPEVMADHKNYTEDPEAILAARERVARLIEEFQRIGGKL